MGPEDATPTGEEVDQSWYISRPSTVLMGLPVAGRWEVTRRHPCYLRFWREANDYYRQPSVDPTQLKIQELAVLLLRNIGVSGPLPPPGASAESLGSTALSQIWQQGAVAPSTYRSLASMLLADLPAEVQVAVGSLLVTAGSLQDSDPYWLEISIPWTIRTSSKSRSWRFPTPADRRNKPVRAATESAGGNRETRPEMEENGGDPRAAPTR